MSANIPSIQEKNDILNNDEMSRILYNDILSLSAFLKAKHPRCIPIALTKGTKTPLKGMEFANDKIDDAGMWKKWDEVGCNLVMNGDCDVGISIRDHWIVIDVDDKRRAEDMLKRPIFKDTVSVRTKKGIHFYFLKTEACNDWVNSVKPFVVKNGDVEEVLDVDVITTWSTGTGGLITFPPSTNKTWIKKMGEVEILPMPDNFVEWGNTYWKTKNTKPHADYEGSAQNTNWDQPGMTDVEQVKFIQGLCDCLSKERADNWEKWIRVGWCLRNIDPRFLPEWIKFSKKSEKFSRGECEYKWDYFKKDGGLKIGTLCRWAKEDNPDMYGQLVANKTSNLIQKAKGGAEYDVALVVKSMFDNFVYAPDKKGGVWYVFRNHHWEKSDEGFALKEKLPTDVTDYFRLHASIALAKAARPECPPEDKDKYDDLGKKLNEVVSKLKRSAFQSNVMTQCAMLFAREKFTEKLDLNLHLVGLRNGVFDLRNREFRKGMPEDMISKQRSHNYNPLNTSVNDEIMKFYREIMPSEGTKDYLLTIRAYGLTGNKYLEKGWLFSGIGRSGKGTEDTLEKAAAGDYYNAPDITMLTEVKKDGNNASPALAEMVGIRSCSMTEPEGGEGKQKQVIMVSVFKKMVGGDDQKGRALYEGIVTFKPQFAPIIQCNEKIALSKFENNLDTKIAVLEFPFKYTDNPVLDYERKIDTTLKIKFASDSNYHECYFNILIDKFYEKGIHKNAPLIAPQEVIDSTREYFNENNPFGVWLNEWFTIEPVNDQTKISAKEFCEYYKEDTGKKLTPAEMGKAMRNLGYKSKHTKKGNVYYGFKRNAAREAERKAEKLAMVEKEEKLEKERLEILRQKVCLRMERQDLEDKYTGTGGDIEDVVDDYDPPSRCH